MSPSYICSPCVFFLNMYIYPPICMSLCIYIVSMRISSLRIYVFLCIYISSLYLYSFMCIFLPCVYMFSPHVYFSSLCVSSYVCPHISFYLYYPLCVSPSINVSLRTCLILCMYLTLCILFCIYIVFYLY